MGNKEMIDTVKKNEENKGFLSNLIKTINAKIRKREIIYRATIAVGSAIACVALLAGGLTVGPLAIATFCIGAEIGVSAYAMEKNKKDENKVKELENNIKEINETNTKIKKEFERQNFASKTPVTNYQKHIYRKHNATYSQDDDYCQ